MLLYEPATNPEGMCFICIVCMYLILNNNFPFHLLGMLAKQAMFELRELRLMKQRIEKSMKKKQ